MTGLARAGKTVFITALIEALLKGGRLPAFAAQSDGRITRAFLEPQPDDDLPRLVLADDDPIYVSLLEQRFGRRNNVRIDRADLSRASDAAYAR